MSCFTNEAERACSFTKQVEPPCAFTKQAERECSCADENPLLPDIMYADSSPGVGGVGASRYFFILPPSADKLYSSKRANPNSGAFAAWQEVSLPAGSWGAFAKSNNLGWTVLLGLDANVATKALLRSVDPDYTVDQPWTKYAVPQILTGAGGFMAPADVDFWSPSNPGTNVIAAINATTLYSGRPDGAEVANPDSINDVWGTETNAIGAGTWKKAIGYDGHDHAGYIREVLVIGHGTNVRRWYDQYNDNQWVNVACPSGNWVDADRDFDVILAVGDPDGANTIMGSVDEAVSFSAITPPVGWTPVNPRVIFDPNLDTGGSNAGHFVIVGGTISGVSAVVLVPVSNVPAFGTPVVATLPSVPAGVAWKSVARSYITAGCLIVGNVGSDVYLLSNPETSSSGTPGAVDDWTLKTLGEAPGIG